MCRRSKSCVYGAIAAVLAAVCAMNAAADVVRIDPPAGSGAMAPHLSVTSSGVLLSWLEPVPHDAGSNEDHDSAASPAMRLRWATFDGEQWSEAQTVVADRAFFANWADLPSVRRDADGTLIAHWLEMAGEGTYAYHVVLARSEDDGATWRMLGRVHPDDASKTEHGFVSAVREAGGIRYFWLDGRAMATDEAGGGHGHGSGDMQLRTARVIGQHVEASDSLDDRVCECCDTAAAMTSTGPVVVYRDRSDDEVRDISIVRRVDDRWTVPRPVHDDGWIIPGCPVNGPAVAASGNHVAVGWFTMVAHKPRVQVAFSVDAGATFDEPIILDRDDAHGRVDVAMTDAGDAMVAWLTTDATGGIIRLQRVRQDRTIGSSVEAVRTNTTRRSGFPKIAVMDGRVLLVWVHPDRPSALRAAAIGSL